MKIYKIKLTIKLLLILFISFFISMTILIFNIESSELLRCSLIVLNILLVLASYIMFATRIVVDEDKIIVKSIGKYFKEKSILFNEIKEVQTYELVFSDLMGMLELINSNDRNSILHINISHFPISLLDDIIKRLSPKTKIVLYPYLENKLNKYRNK